MDLNWKRIKQQNIYDALYISDSSDSDNEKDKKRTYKCVECKRKDFSRKSYKNNNYNKDNSTINNNIKIIEDNIKKLSLDDKTNDNSLIPNKKPRNFGCGIYY